MSLNEIQKQIKSTQSTAQITRAMQLVSNNKYHQMVEEAENYHRYNDELHKLVTHAIHQHMVEGGSTSFDQLDNDSGYTFQDFLVTRPVKRTGYLVITSDKGLAGSYNSSIIKAVDQMFKQNHKSNDEVVILAVGDPIVKYCRENGIEIAYEVHNMPNYPSFTQVQKLIQNAVKLYRTHIFDELYLCYNHHINALTNRLIVSQILPMGERVSKTTTRHQDKHPDKKVVDLEADILMEPSVTEVLEVLVPQYAESQIYGAIIDAKTAEQASRMSAMKSATENAEEMIGKLQLEYQKARQMGLTNEVIEIINGASAQDDDAKEIRSGIIDRESLVKDIYTHIPDEWLDENGKLTPLED